MSFVSPRRERDPLMPGQWLGILGGGQLGRMFCHAAQSLGYRVAVLDPDPHSPAGAVAERHLCRDYLDQAALAELAQLCPSVSTEFENVPAAAFSFLAERTRVSPSAKCISIAQDRIVEKRFIADTGLSPAPHAVIRAASDLAAIDPRLFPAILKAARLGYDGKGQLPVADAEQARQAFDRLGACDSVLERRLPLAAEISVIIARGFDGVSVSWPVFENLHRAGILALTNAPARVDPAIAANALAAAKRLADAMDYVGVLCVEFFVLTDASLIVNEMAPRPHNSGHLTIDASLCSQFEQQARVMAGLPLGDVDLLRPAAMINLLGDLWFDGTQPREPDWIGALSDPRAKLHLYGKREPRHGRKMGHLTLLADTVDEARQRALRIAARLGITGLPDA